MIILTDDQGYGDVGVTGNRHIRTPNLDRFATTGIRFRRFYCSPVCAPTRASLLTGRYYYRTGVIHTSRGGAKMHSEEVTLAEHLAKGGYRNGIFGKWHLGDNYPMRPQDQGFHETLVHKSGGIGQTPDKPNSYFDPVLWKNGKRVQAKGYCTDVFFNAAMRFIEKNGERPFFVYLPTNAPHAPLEVAKKYSDPYLKKDLDETTAKVYGMVQNIDENFGRLMKKLDALKLRDNTIVVFLSDNGPQQRRYNVELRGRKGTTYEGGIRVPCFMQWPAKWKGDRKINHIAAHIDITPTILRACGVPFPKRQTLDGVSLLPLLEGKEKGYPDDRMLFFQCHRSLTPTPYRNAAVVMQRAKLVCGPGTFSKAPAKNKKPVLELYDLQADPGERTNLIDRQPQLAARLKQRYREWFADVQSSRRFTPGVIHVGTKQETPPHLCRYQDSNYRDGKPTGWSIRIVNGGTYELSFRRNELKGKGTLSVSWQGTKQTKPLPADKHSVTVKLGKGSGTLDVWFTDAAGRRRTVVDNSTTGDVELRRLTVGAESGD